MQAKLERMGGPYTVEEIFQHVTEDVNVTDPRIDFGKFTCKVSNRIKTFRTKGTKCVKCGVEGTVFYAERSPGQAVPHLNLYAIVEGEEILITQDHIIPKALSGSDRVYNLQPMCMKCNVHRGAPMEEFCEHLQIPEDPESIKQAFGLLLKSYNILRKDLDPFGNPKRNTFVKELNAFLGGYVKQIRETQQEAAHEQQ